MDTRNYFQAYHDYLWQWEEDHTVLAVPNGPTIAYWRQVQPILRLFAHQGLPPFGALLMTLLATKKDSKPNWLSVKLAHLESRDIVDDQVISDANAFLNQFLDLPESYKRGKLRVKLLRQIFQGAHNSLSAKRSKDIVENLHTPESIQHRTSAAIPLEITALKKDIHCLSLLYRKYPTTKAMLGAMADLPELEATNLPELEPKEQLEPQPEDFMEALLDNRMTFYVGALVKRIWGGLNIPFHNKVPSQQPFGGISDITNKGDFDKLLFSEFANDDLVFLSRLANNEALFIIGNTSGQKRSEAHYPDRCFYEKLGEAKDACLCYYVGHSPTSKIRDRMYPCTGWSEF